MGGRGGCGFGGSSWDLGELVTGLGVVVWNRTFCGISVPLFRIWECKGREKERGC